jgi:hypothetical protein
VIYSKRRKFIRNMQDTTILCVFPESGICNSTRSHGILWNTGSGLIMYNHMHIPGAGSGTTSTEIKI